MALTSRPREAVLSDWSEWHPVDDWGPCVGGVQYRGEERGRTVITPAVPTAEVIRETLHETRTISRTCVVHPPPDGESNDGTVITGESGYIQDASGARWTLVAGGPDGSYYPMRNGANHSGSGQSLVYRGHQLYLINSLGAEYTPTADGWARVYAVTPPPGTLPPPAGATADDPNKSHVDGGPLPTFPASVMRFDGMFQTGGYHFIKHTQGMSSSAPDDPHVRFCGGDLAEGSFPLDRERDGPVPPRQAGLNTVLRLNTITMEVEQLVSRFGNPADGTAPYNPDGCTTVWTGSEVVVIKGFQAPYNAEDTDDGKAWRARNDPYGIMQADYGKIFIFNEARRSWRATALAGSAVWTPEAWTGSHHRGTDRVYAVADAPGGSEYGALRICNPYETDQTKAFTYKRMRKALGVTNYGDIGWGFDALPWASAIIDDVMYWPDFYRRWLWGVNVLDESPQPFKVARIRGLVPVTSPSGEIEQIGSQEAGVASSVLRNKVFISYPPALYCEGGESGILDIDVLTGHVSEIQYPDDMGPVGDFKRMANVLAFCDATSRLIATGNSDEPLSGQFLVFEFPPTPPLRPVEPLTWLKDVGQKSIAPNSIALGANGGVSTAFLADIGITPSTSANDIIRIPDNENGVPPLQDDGLRAAVDRAFGEGGGLRSFSGNWWDNRPYGAISDYPVTMFNCGDSATGWSQIAAYEFSNAGGWVQDVVRSGHSRKFRNASPEIENAAAAAHGRVIDQRPYKTLDGTALIAGHLYFGPQYIRSRAMLIQDGTNNRYPRDTGRNREVVCADTATRSWMYAEPIEPAGETGTETPIKFGCKETDKKILGHRQYHVRT